MQNCGVILDIDIHKYLREGDAMDDDDNRTVEIPPGDLREMQPVRRYLTDTTPAGDQLLEPTYEWTWADRAEWALCWFGPVTAVSAALWLIAMVCVKSI